MKKINLIIIIVFLLILNTIKAQNTDTLRLYYEINSYTLTRNQQTQIDSFFSKTKQLKITKISIKGYTDYLGSDAYNLILSGKRATTVADYIKSKSISTNEAQKQGKGKLPPFVGESKEGIQANRMVEIVVNYTQKLAEKSTELKKISSLKIGEQMILKNVNFHPGSHQPLKEAQPALRELLITLKENPTMEIEIQGHICCSPPDQDGFDYQTGQQNLSVERAKYVYTYLTLNGIDKERLSYVGFGGKIHLVQNEVTEEDKIQNRRVEIKIIKK